MVTSPSIYLFEECQVDQNSSGRNTSVTYPLVYQYLKVVHDNQLLSGQALSTTLTMLVVADVISLTIVLKVYCVKF